MNDLPTLTFDPADTCLKVEQLSVSYEGKTALREVSLTVPRHRVTAFIGPSGCGKSTLLRSFNRMNDLIRGVEVTGQIQLFGEDILAPAVDVTVLRRRVGMVFQQPNPFPMSVFDNIAYGLRLQGLSDQRALEREVEWALRSAALWDEVKDRLEASALTLSGGQQQRLVIARAIAIRPEVLLLDEPASALDPISTLKIEELIGQLAEAYSIIVVTHNMQQAARVSDYTAFLYLGELVELAPRTISSPGLRHGKRKTTITGRYG